MEEVVAVEGGRKTVRRSPVLGKGEEEQTAERQPAFQELRHRLVGRPAPHRARLTNCTPHQAPLVLLHSLPHTEPWNARIWERCKAQDSDDQYFSLSHEAVRMKDAGCLAVTRRV